MIPGRRAAGLFVLFVLVHYEELDAQKAQESEHEKEHDYIIEPIKALIIAVGAICDHQPYCYDSQGHVWPTRRGIGATGHLEEHNYATSGCANS